MRRVAAVSIALALALAGCGGDDEEEGGGTAAATSTPTATAEQTPDEASGGGDGETLTLSAPADGSLAFEPGQLSAAAGTVTIEFANEASIPHAVAIEGNGVEESSETINGGSTSLSADLEAGEYTFYCPVGSHRDGGMEGTLTVE